MRWVRTAWRAFATMLVSILIVIAAISLVTDLCRFWTLADLCHGTEPNTADYCTNTYKTECLPVPANCPSTFPGYLAPEVFNLQQIVAPDWLHASIFGYAYWLLQLIVASIYNTALFGWYVVRQPFLTNPVLWIVLFWTFTYRETPVAPVNPLLKSVQDQKALGDASTARAKDVHRALIGRSTTPTQEFEK